MQKHRFPSDLPLRRKKEPRGQYSLHINNAPRSVSTLKRRKKEQCCKTLSSLLGERQRSLYVTCPLPGTLYKNPLLSLIILLSSPLPASLPLLPSAAPLTLPLPPHSLPPLPEPLSILNPFQPSSSRSSLKPFSFSSRRSLSALRAASWLFVSSACSSSTVCKRRSILSLPFETSSESCWACFSRREIWACRSRTVRS